MGHRAVSVAAARGGGVMVQYLRLQKVVAVVAGLRSSGGG